MKRRLTFAITLGAVGAAVHLWTLMRIYGWNVPWELVLLWLVLGVVYAIGFSCWYSFLSKRKQGWGKELLFALFCASLVYSVLGVILCFRLSVGMVLSLLPLGIFTFSGTMLAGAQTEESENRTAE